MIVKNLDACVPVDARAAAGQKAEQELAFYLRRAFKDSPDLLVFNGLRFVFGEDVAQIDHLVLHRHGVILVESKSVTTKVEVNERGEWVRWFDGAPQGMPSPILQARRQGEFLKRYLNAHAEDLLGKLLGLQKRFGGMEIDVIVAISDNGIIVRPKRSAKGIPLEEVRKADQVVDLVRAIHAKHQKANGLRGFVLASEGGYSWSSDEVQRLKSFLQERHRPAPDQPPFAAQQSSPALRERATVVSRNPTEPVCAECGVTVSEKVVLYCRDHAHKFGGRILCFNHQRERRPEI